MTTKLCQITNAPFQVSVDEEQAYEMLGLSVPELSPEERLRRLLAFKQGMRMFWRECSASKNKIYSGYPENVAFPVYGNDYWWGKDWDPFSYGRNFSLRRGFFEQFYEFWRQVPRPAVNLHKAQRVSAVNNVFDVSECYCVYDSVRVRRGLYSVGLHDSTLCMDCLYLYGCELCYECIDCHRCSELYWSESCSHCSSSYFIANCRNCRNCLFCTNLADTQYCIYNQQLTPEEYQRTLEEWNFGDRNKIEAAREEFTAFCHEQPLPHVVCDNFTALSGNYLYQAREILDSFHCSESSRLVHCHDLVRAESCLNGFAFGEGINRCGQFVNVGLNAKKVTNSIDCWSNVEDLAYCSHCYDSAHLFGCIGLRNAEFCILNKQYSKSGYYELRGYIDQYLKSTGVSGEFYPNSFAPLPYNVSLANELMPLGRVQARLFTYNWDEQLESTFKPSDVVAQIEEYKSMVVEVPVLLAGLDELTPGKVHICEFTGAPFQIVEEEIEFYRRLGVAAPVRCFEQRHRERMMKLGPRKLDYRRSSDQISKIRTAFNEEWPRPVLDFETWLDTVRKTSVKTMTGLVKFIDLLPLNQISYVTGRIARWRWPRAILRPLLWAYCRAYGVCVEECGRPLSDYESFQEFFTRELKPGLRPVGEGLVSPVDGRIDQSGHVENGLLLQVKGKSYTLSDLLVDGELVHMFDGGMVLHYIFSAWGLSPHSRTSIGKNSIKRHHTG